jgi:hypothetical protein
MINSRQYIEFLLFIYYTKKSFFKLIISDNMGSLKSYRKIHLSFLNINIERR